MQGGTVDTAQNGVAVFDGLGPRCDRGRECLFGFDDLELDLVRLELRLFQHQVQHDIFLEDIVGNSYGAKRSGGGSGPDHGADDDRWRRLET